VIFGRNVSTVQFAHRFIRFFLKRASKNAVLRGVLNEIEPSQLESRNASVSSGADIRRRTNANVAQLQTGMSSLA